LIYRVGKHRGISSYAAFADEIPRTEEARRKESNDTRARMKVHLPVSSRRQKIPGVHLIVLLACSVVVDWFLLISALIRLFDTNVDIFE
jgi:hypothetical protein